MANGEAIVLKPKPKFLPWDQFGFNT